MRNSSKIEIPENAVLSGDLARKPNPLNHYYIGKCKIKCYSGESLAMPLNQTNLIASRKRKINEGSFCFQKESAERNLLLNAGVLLVGKQKAHKAIFGTRWFSWKVFGEQIVSV